MGEFTAITIETTIARYADAVGIDLAVDAGLSAADIEDAETGRLVLERDEDGHWTIGGLGEWSGVDESWLPLGGHNGHDDHDIEVDAECERVARELGAALD